MINREMEIIRGRLAYWCIQQVAGGGVQVKGLNPLSATSTVANHDEVQALTRARAGVGILAGVEMILGLGHERGGNVEAVQVA